MRAFWVALGLALMAGGLARAADLTDPVWARAPDRTDWAKVYPAQAAKAGIAGAVKLKCEASSAGLLQDCLVVSEAPNGQGFGAAALSLAAGMELKPNGLNGQPVAGRNLIVPVKFDPALLRPGTVIVTPDWMKRPSLDSMAEYFPAEATPSGGAVKLDCVITNRGLVDDCKVMEEKPTGHGYAASALAISQLFLMRPMTIDGLPVGGARVEIPMKFASGATRPPPGSIIHVITIAPYSAAPTSDQLSAAFPKGAIGKVPSAHVVLRCSLNGSGRLNGCDKVSESPEGKGFEHAAQSLVKDFRVITNRKVDEYGALRIDVPFDFRDPSLGPQAVEAHNPRWLTGIDPAVALRLYPAVALKAGVRSGRATISCTVIHDGSLTACQIDTEEPADMGFGDAALQIAPLMKMNPWTSQGAPVDGMRINLPIRLVAPDEQPAAAATVASPAK